MGIVENNVSISVQRTQARALRLYALNKSYLREHIYYTTSLFIWHLRHRGAC